MAKTHDAELLELVKRIAPGYYTERDGGDWYIVAPHDGPVYGRIGEGFANRDDARRGLAWLAGEPMPKGWSVHKRSGSHIISADLDCGQGYWATIWTREACQAFPARAKELVP